MARKPSLKTKSTATIGFETKLWLAADKVRNSMEMIEHSRAEQIVERRARRVAE
jgi:hypothetical protein